MHYSIIVPAWNEAAFIDQTLQSLQRAMAELAGATAHHGELIVVDNNSSDETARLAEAAGARVVFEKVNQIARARNRGASVATGDALVFIDADTVCSAALLQEALDGLEHGNRVGGGAIIAPDKPVSAAAARGIALWNRLATMLRLAAGCFVYCRRDAFESVGGFSHRVYAGEEIFLSRQLKRWGRRRQLAFVIITSQCAVTSVRKLDWYSPMQIARQAALILIPGAVFSKRLCRTWYDTNRPRNSS